MVKGTMNFTLSVPLFCLRLGRFLWALQCTVGEALSQTAVTDSPANFIMEFQQSRYADASSYHSPLTFPPYEKL